MFPTYLLTDSGFWWFSFLYMVGVAVIVGILLLLQRYLSVPPQVGKHIPIFISVLFTYLVIEQFFHQAEHVAQMYQFAFLNIPAHDAHGFVWFLDEEWNHFIFNSLYFTGVIVVFIYLLRALKKSGIRKTAAHVGFIVIFSIWEGWHMIEHTYRIIHHVQGLCDECSGIIDQWFGINRLVLHFWFNFFALVFPMVVYIWYGVPSGIFAVIRKRFGRKL